MARRGPKAEEGRSPELGVPGGVPSETTHLLEPVSFPLIREGVAGCLKPTTVGVSV